MYSDLNEETKEKLRIAFFPTVFAWMAAGLGISALAAQGISYFPVILNIPIPYFWILLVVEMGIALLFRWKIDTHLPLIARVMFLVYAVLNGIVLTLPYYLLKGAQVAISPAPFIFSVLALAFAMMAVYGVITKKELTSVNNVMVLWALGSFLVVLFSILFHFKAVYWISGLVCAFLFPVLLVIDMGKLESLSAEGVAQHTFIRGALRYYLGVILLPAFAVEAILNLINDSRPVYEGAYRPGIKPPAADVADIKFMHDLEEKKGEDKDE